MEQNPVRVLHIVGSMHPGGMENFIMNLYRKIDRNRIQFDFVVHMRREDDYVDLIHEMGGEVYVLPRLTRKPFSNLYGLYRLVKKKRYPVVVRHTPNALVAPQVYAAKLGGAVTVCHSHNTTDPQRLLHKIGKAFMMPGRIERFACSEDAGRWMFGKRKFRVVHNAVDMDQYSFHQSGRKKIREEFSIREECRIYGHVANFISSKNHGFLLEVYKEISKLDEKAEFFCIGDGELRKETEEKAERLGIREKVHFTGVRYDVEDFLSCMDVLIFPSKFEGLPLTLIEAQAAGLPCLLSEAVTRSVEVTSGLIFWKSIEEAPEQWAKKAYDLACGAKEAHAGRECQRASIAAAGYDIQELARWYEDYFLTHAGCSRRSGGKTASK